MDWMKYRFIYFLLSGVVIGMGVFSLIKWGLKIGIDFRGGTILELRLDKEVSTEDMDREIEGKEIKVTSIQKSGADSYIFRFSELGNEEKNLVFQAIKDLTNADPTELRFESVGASFGPELVKKTLYAMTLATGAILLWVAYQFKNFKYGISAILAMIHDSLVVIGSFSLFGHILGIEIDFLFITALLTTLSFSVHDTIVVYDRIREKQRKIGGDLYNLCNQAVTETMVRSLNNSFTIIFMLVALVLMGGSTVKWFVIALLIGTISGTYSSPFVAVPILVTWDEIAKAIRLRRISN